MAKRGSPSGKCARCHRRVNYLERDHRIPLWAGGPNDADNLQWLCRSCHRLKTRIELGSPKYKAYRRSRYNHHGSGHPVFRTVFMLLIIAVVLGMIF